MAKLNASQAVRALDEAAKPRKARALLEFVERSLAEIDQVDFIDSQVSRDEYVTMLYSYRCLCKLRLAVEEIKAELDPKSRKADSPFLKGCLDLILPIEDALDL